MLVSVIIANHNKGPYLEACVRSVQVQTHTDLEIVVVDDASSDGSAAILRGLAREFTNVRVLWNRVQVGPAASRHRGITRANGDLITTLDSDDIYLSPNKVEEEVRALEELSSPTASIAYSGVKLIDRQGDEVGVMIAARKHGPRDLFRCIVTRSCPIPRDFLFWKTQYFDVGGFDRRFDIFEDWDLKIRLAERFTWVQCAVVGVGYRQTPTGLSASTIESHNEWIWRVFEKNVCGRGDVTALRHELRRNVDPSIVGKLRRRVRRLLSLK